MNFYICSVGEKNSDYIEDNLERCISYKGHFMHKATTHKGAFDDVQNNDIIFLKYNNNLIAFGEVISKDSSENSKLNDWNYAIYVNEWYFYDKTNIKKGVGRYGIQEATLKGDQFATIKQIDEDFALDKIVKIAGKDNPLFIKIKKIADETNNNKMILSLLTDNHNLILTGAPGTGKTYLAKQIAQQMIFGEVIEKMSLAEEKRFNEQCGFVQFHPSYDYTDFVEGMRPVQDDGGNVGFERKDGVFKEFCKTAVKNAIDSKKSLDDLKKDKTFEEKYYEIINKIGNGEISKFDLRKGIQMDIVEVSKGDNIILRTHESEKTHTVSLNRLAKLAKIYPDVESLNNISNIDKEIRKVIKGCHSSSYWAVLKAVYEQSSSEKVEVAPIKIEEKNFVFIIDEINRGEISKIFGELFFSIDPGYRGEKGKVKTQYQNLIEEDDEFYDGFYVPENVYIIGTMNDIDRSVESMDFAFRRRFAFKEIKATDRVEMLDDLTWKDEAVKRMNRLNAKIEIIEGLSSAYHIGPAYFLKLKNYNGDFDQLWENHLEGLLREYLRGMQNLEEKLKTLKAAYDNESDSNSGQQQE